MGLAKFRCYKPEEEDYINVSIVCSNITRGNSEWDSNNIDHSISGPMPEDDYIDSENITNPRYANEKES